MTAMPDRVIEEVLSLPADIRLNLVEKLITSLNLPIDKDVNLFWAEEAECCISKLKQVRLGSSPARRFSPISEQSTGS